MSNDDFVSEVMCMLRERGFLVISDDFIDQLITILHANATTINTMTQIAEIETKLQSISIYQPTDRQVNSLKELSQRISEIAFNVEDVRHDQRAPCGDCAGNQYSKPSRKYAKRKSYYKKYRKQRKPNQSQARG